MSAWNKTFNTILRNSPRIVVSVALVIAIGLGYKFYQDSQEADRRYQELVGKTSDYDQITDALAKLRTDYADQKKLQERLAEEWANEKEHLEGRIKALADATFEGDNETHDVTLTGDLLAFNTNFCCDNGKKGPAVTHSKVKGISIENNELKSMQFETGVLDHEIKMKAAVTKDESTGEVRILTKAFWVQKDGGGEWEGKPYPLNITGGSIIIDPTEPIDINLKNRFRFAPHINIGAFAGVAQSGGQLGAHVDLSLWGYGKTSNDLLFKLGQIGINGGKDYVDANLIPVSYNVGTHIPLVSDLYVGPGIGYGTEGSMFFLTLSKTL